MTKYEIDRKITIKFLLIKTIEKMSNNKERGENEEQITSCFDVTVPYKPFSTSIKLRKGITV